MKTFNKVLLGYHFFLEFKLREKITEHICRDSDKCVKSSKKKWLTTLSKWTSQCSHWKRESLGGKVQIQLEWCLWRWKLCATCSLTWSFKVPWGIPRTYPHPYSFSTQFTQWPTMSLNFPIGKNDWNHENWNPFFPNIYIYFPGNKPIFYLIFNSCFYSVVQLIQTLVHLENQTLIISDI